VLSVRKVANGAHPSIPSRIIVSDSHPLFRCTLSDLLRGPFVGGEVVAEVSDVQEAVKSCCRLRPDLVVMEVPMSEVDCLQAIRAIKHDSPSTSVLILSAYGENPILLAEALEAGASGYILKSATPQEITGAVCKALEGACPVDQGVATQALLRLLGRSQKEPLSSLGKNPRSTSVERTLVALPASLTPREEDVLGLLAQGYSNRQIAHSLFISLTTVKKHVERIISKLGVSTRTEAAVKASRIGLLDSPDHIEMGH
jgi:DNA-binding NarL/FixJ family response regulator